MNCVCVCVCMHARVCVCICVKTKLQYIYYDIYTVARQRIIVFQFRTLLFARLRRGRPVVAQLHGI